MLSAQMCAAALATTRRMHLQLSEALDLTKEMLDALGRRDQVSVRMFLNMRQEQVNQLREEQELLRRRCAAAEEGGEELRQILNGGASAQMEAQELCRQVERNRALLDKLLQLDRLVNRRMGGEKSYYESTQPAP